MWMIIAICGALSALMLALSVGTILRAAVADVRDRGADVPNDSRWRVYPELLMQDFNKAPARAQRAQDLDAKLVQAARPGQLTGAQYLALSELSTIAVAIIVLGLGLLGQFGVLTTGLAAAVAAGLTWWILQRQVDGWVSTRQRAISREFPYFLDLAVLMMGAGANFGEVLQGYLMTAGQSRLAVDIRALAAEVKYGVSTDAALGLLESRIPAPDVVSVIRAIRQGIRMGTPLSTTFKDQAEAIRFRRSQHAERDAEELKVKLQGPTMLLMIAILLLVLGPALVSMRGGGM